MDFYSLNKFFLLVFSPNIDIFTVFSEKMEQLYSTIYYCGQELRIKTAKLQTIMLKRKIAQKIETIAQKHSNPLDSAGFKSNFSYFVPSHKLRKQREATTIITDSIIY